MPHRSFSIYWSAALAVALLFLVSPISRANITGNAGSAGGSVNLGSSFVPGSIGLNMGSPALNMGGANPALGGFGTLGPMGGGGGSNGLLQACMQALNSIGKMGGVGNAAEQSAIDQLERDGFTNPGGDRGKWAGIGRAINARFGSGCQKFIDKEGNLGPWGKYVEAQMKETGAYDKMHPADVSRYCPKFGGLGEDSRRRFWVHIFASMAQPESSCSPGVVGTGWKPGVKPMGLYQLEPPACARVGMSVSNQDLLNPYVNMKCAVRLFAREMSCRDTIKISHSKARGPGGCGTYWAPLRSRTSHGGDAKAGAVFDNLAKKFGECR